MKILIVDDEVPFLNLLKRYLELWGHECASAVSGQTAMEALRDGTYDLVLLDIFLPDVKGYDLIPIIRRHLPNIDVITMTGYNTRELESIVRQQDILFYMIKPFEASQLKEILEHLSKKKIAAAM
jgi:DNA-binding NtrC family response regulator